MVGFYIFMGASDREGGLIVSSAIPCLNLGILGWLACGAHSHHLRRALGGSVDHDVDHDVGAEWGQNYSKAPDGEGLHWHSPWLWHS